MLIAIPNCKQRLENFKIMLPDVLFNNCYCQVNLQICSTTKKLLLESVHVLKKLATREFQKRARNYERKQLLQIIIEIC